MRNPIPVKLEKFRGIFNNGEAPGRTREHPGTWLKDSYNWDIEKNGIISVRPGYELELAGAFGEGAYPMKQGVLVDYNGRLAILFPEWNFAVRYLRPYSAYNRWSFAYDGNAVWATNEEVIGYIEDEDWHDLPAVTQTFKHPMPPGHLLEYYRGRLYVAMGNIIICSDPAALHFFDEREDSNMMIVNGMATMLRAVADGIWASDYDGIFFLKGLSPNEFERVQVSNYPAFRGTDAYIQSVVIGGQKYDDCVMVTTTKGICLLGNGGSFINFSETSFTMPAGQQGCAVFKRGELNQYISILR